MSLSDLKLVTLADMAKIFGVCEKTVEKDVRERRIPPPIRFGSRAYWHPDDVRLFLDGTFRQHKPVKPTDMPATEKDAPQVGASAAARPNTKVAADSNPVVRQQRRQKARLQQLNSGI